MLRFILSHGSIGHIWLGSFKAFLCQDDANLLTLLRNVEPNALRTSMVDTAVAETLSL